MWEVVIYKKHGGTVTSYIQSFCFIKRVTGTVRYFSQRGDRSYTEPYEPHRFTIFKIRRKYEL